MSSCRSETSAALKTNGVGIEKKQRPASVADLKEGSAGVNAGRMQR